jgi:hypothetical protein
MAYAGVRERGPTYTYGAMIIRSFVHAGAYRRRASSAAMLRWHWQPNTPRCTVLGAWPLRPGDSEEGTLLPTHANTASLPLESHSAVERCSLMISS